MAGSQTIRGYKDDSGAIYAIKINKNNANATIDGTIFSPPLIAAAPALPRGTMKRYLLAYDQANPKIRRKFYAGDVAALKKALVAGATFTSVEYPKAGDTAGVTSTWVPTFYCGEKSRLTSALLFDTGLDDGNTAP